MRSPDVYRLGMRVLVAHVSRYGSTEQMAHQVADVLAGAGHDVVCVPVDDVGALDGYDALVFGSAIYTGAWPASAVAFVDRVVAETPAMPTWVFASGPLGDTLQGSSAQADAEAARLQPRDYVVFPGVGDPARLDDEERGIAAQAGLPAGDFSDPPALQDWARGVAAQIGGEPADW